MTKEEHNLVISMLAVQHQLVWTMADILKSHGLIQGDDLAAFSSITRQKSNSSLDAIKKAYLGLAKQMGVVTGLEG